MDDVELSEDQRSILDFEQQWWKYAGGKSKEIQARFGISPVWYYRELNTILDLPGALAYDPILVRRLQRARALRRRRRATLTLRVARSVG